MISATVLAVIKIVATVVSVAVSLQSAQKQKKAAKRTAALQIDRKDLEEQDRALKKAALDARLRREARIKRAQLTNVSAARGFLRTTGFQGAFTAIGSGAQRELNLAQGTFALAGQADDITRAQINLNAQAQAATATSGAISAGISGIGSIAEAASNIDFNELFSSDEEIPQNDEEVG